MAEESTGGDGNRKVALVAGLGLIGVGAYQLFKGSPKGCGFKPGSLVKGSSAKVYVITADCRKQWITSASVFNACNYDWGQIQTVSDAAINGVPSGPDLTAPPCPPGPPAPAPAAPAGPTGPIVLAQPSLIVRSGPGTGYQALGSLVYGTAVQIVCQAVGSRVANSSIWDQIASPWGPGWVSDWWLSTPGVGTFSAGYARCAGAPPANPGGGGGTPTGLAGTGSPSAPPVITSPDVVQPGWIISTGCGWNQADYVVIHDVNGYGKRLSRVWIRDYATWARLGAPRNAIRVVTANVIYAIRDRGRIYFDGSWHFDSLPAGWWLISGMPNPPNIVASNAGYCS